MLELTFVLLSLTQAEEPADAHAPKVLITNLATESDQDKLIRLKLERFNLDRMEWETRRIQLRHMSDLGTLPAPSYISTDGKLMADISVQFPNRALNFNRGSSKFDVIAAIDAYATTELSRIKNEIARHETEIESVGYQMKLKKEAQELNPFVPLKIKATSIEEVTALLAKMQADPKAYCNLDICIEITGSERPASKQFEKLQPGLEKTLESKDFHHELAQ